jgi:membrane-associated phospholipid phosphatase
MTVTFQDCSSTPYANDSCLGNTTRFRQISLRSLIAVLLCLALVLFCYFFLDQPVAFFVHEQDFAQYAVLKWLTYPPPILQAWVPVVLVALMLRRACGPFRRWEKALLAASVAMVLADQCRQTLAFGCGRYWPETWIDNNPSLIRDGAYGFHPFHSGTEYGSFPSGHTARTLAIAAVIWLAYPGWRWACIVASVAVSMGLLGMNYHFVGDVVAGGFVGAIVGTYVVYFGALTAR